MNTARLAVIGAATMLAFAGFAHASVGPLRAAVPGAAIQHANVPATATYQRGDIVAVSDLSAPSVRSGWVEAPNTREPIYSIETPKASEAPLPGALWLFGSALLAFLGISARRRF